MLATLHNSKQCKSKHLEEQCPTCDPLMIRLGQKLKFAQQTQTSMKCKVSGKVMNDQNQPYWVPIKRPEPTDKQKEEAKKNKNLEIELKMNQGYLICHQVYKDLEVEQIEAKALNEKSDSNDKVNAVKCPMTGNYVELSKIRKVFFC